MSDNSQESSAASGSRRVVIDLGKKSSDSVKKLRKGKGKLMSKVDDQLDALREEGVISDSAEVVVVVVERRSSMGPGKGMRMPRLRM